jgi:Holliday junction DNA helicase RuvA
MIGSLRGQVASRLLDGTVIVDVHGVGYRVAVTPRTLTQLEPGRDAELAVHTHVREDAIVLYGFLDPRERDCFEALIAAQGVGPGLAQAILGTLGPDALASALAAEDLDALCVVPGVGRKTAARLLLELRGRLALPDAATEERGQPPVRVEVRAALGELGYGPEEVRRALEAIDDTGTVEDALRQALRALSRR